MTSQVKLHFIKINIFIMQAFIENFMKMNVLKKLNIRVPESHFFVNLRSSYDKIRDNRDLCS